MQSNNCILNVHKCVLIFLAKKPIEFYHLISNSVKHSKYLYGPVNKSENLLEFSINFKKTKFSLV